MKVLGMEDSEEEFFPQKKWCFQVSAKKYTKIYQVQAGDFTQRISLGIRKEVPE